MGVLIYSGNFVCRLSEPFVKNARVRELTVEVAVLVYVFTIFCSAVTMFALYFRLELVTYFFVTCAVWGTVFSVLIAIDQRHNPSNAYVIGREVTLGNEQWSS